ERPLRRWHTSAHRRIMTSLRPRPMTSRRADVTCGTPLRKELPMQWSLEVVVLPVSDIDRAIAFYRDQLGFHLDHDTHNEHMHVVQLTPPGSGCSIVFGDLPSQNEMAPGSMRALQLVVSDAAAARQELLDRGVETSDLM